jgi:hypothetical protein
VINAEVTVVLDVSRGIASTFFEKSGAAELQMHRYGCSGIHRCARVPDRCRAVVSALRWCHNLVNMFLVCCKLALALRGGVALEEAAASKKSNRSGAGRPLTGGLLHCARMASKEEGTLL